MKTHYLSHAFLAVSALLFIKESAAQNVGIGTSVPLDKLHVVGSIRSTTLAGVGNRLVLADPNGTLMVGGAAGSPAWLVTGNTGLIGGNTTTAGTNFLGTTDAVNVDFRTANTYRGRISSLGEFFWGTFNTTIPGDFLNVVCNGTFYWGVNGYSPPGANGGAVYGQIQPGNTTIFGAVQGEYFGTSPSGAGVRGIAGTGSAIGVHGQEPSLAGWAVLAGGDVGAILPGNFYTISDQRLKKNVVPLANSLDKVMAMHGYTYDVNREAYPKYMQADRRIIGFLAQELEQVLPEAVTMTNIPSANVNRENPDKVHDSMQVKAVNMNAVIPVLVEAMKEQQQLINDLRARIAALEGNQK